MSIFNELQASLEEAVEIKHGRKKPARVTRYEIADVKSIREDLLKVTQAEFAKTMGVSVDTIKSWESKRRNPAGLAAKVLATIRDDPKIYAALAAHQPKNTINQAKIRLPRTTAADESLWVKGRSIA